MKKSHLLSQFLSKYFWLTLWSVVDSSWPTFVFIHLSTDAKFSRNTFVFIVLSVIHMFYLSHSLICSFPHFYWTSDFHKSLFNHGRWLFSLLLPFHRCSFCILSDQQQLSAQPHLTSQCPLFFWLFFFWSIERTDPWNTDLIFMFFSRCFPR